MPDTAARPGGPHLRGAVVERHRLQRPLPAVPASARLARVTARAACRAWRVPDAGDAAALLASELVTAALQHVPRGQLTLRVLMTPRRLRLEVHEPTGVLPVEVERDGGPHSLLVEGCSVRCGVQAVGGGRQLFAELSLPEPGTGDTGGGAAVTPVTS